MTQFRISSSRSMSKSPSQAHLRDNLQAAFLRSNQQSVSGIDHSNVGACHT